MSCGVEAEVGWGGLRNVGRPRHVLESKNGLPVQCCAVPACRHGPKVPDGVNNDCVMLWLKCLRVALARWGATQQQAILLGHR